MDDDDDDGKFAVQPEKREGKSKRKLNAKTNGNGADNATKQKILNKFLDGFFAFLFEQRCPTTGASERGREGGKTRKIRKWKNGD